MASGFKEINRREIMKVLLSSGVIKVALALPLRQRVKTARIQRPFVQPAIKSVVLNSKNTAASRRINNFRLGGFRN